MLTSHGTAAAIRCRGVMPEKRFWVRDHGPSVEIRYSAERIAVHTPANRRHQVVTLRHHHVGIPTHSRDASGFVNKNGAVLEGRRRYGMNPASSDTKQDLGCDPDTKR